MGYPKTATTTIQDSILTKLHTEGKINFLGKSQLLQTEDITSNDEIVVNLNNENVPLTTKEFKLSNDKINVLSNEHFLQSVHNNNLITIANRLHQYLTTCHNDTKTHIIITLRNQASLIHSLFTEVYTLYLRHKKTVDTLEKYLDEGFAKGNNGFFSMYYYADILDTYTQLFGRENITILFFEDLQQDTHRFFSPLSHLLEIDEELLIQEMTQKKNEKIKTVKGYKTSDFTLGLFISDLLNAPLLKGVSKNIRNNILIKKIYHNTLKKVADKIKLSSGKHIPYLTEKDKERVIDAFQLSNEKLWQDFSLPREKLIKYGYLKP